MYLALICDAAKKFQVTNCYNIMLFCVTEI